MFLKLGVGIRTCHAQPQVVTTKMYLTSQNSAIRAEVKTCVAAVLASCVGIGLLNGGVHLLCLSPAVGSVV